MFPENQIQGNENLKLAIENESSKNFGKTFLFDFDQGEFVINDGKLKVIDGKEAVIMWIAKMIKTDKGKCSIYNITDGDYGIRLIDLLDSSSPVGFIYADIQKNITAALMQHPDIFNVSEFVFDRSKRTLIVSFNVTTKYGDITEGVNI